MLFNGAHTNTRLINQIRVILNKYTGEKVYKRVRSDE